MAKFNDAHDKLKSLIDEAHLVLTDTEIERLKPKNPGDMASAVQALKKAMSEREVAGGPFAEWGPADDERPDLRLVETLTDPWFFPWACKHLFNNKQGQPLDVPPLQHVTLMELWWRRFPILVASRGFSKTYSLALNILLKLAFKPGHQIAVVGRSLRQSKHLYEYCQSIWKGSPMFRALVGEDDKNGPRAAPNEGQCSFRIGDSVALFLPLGHSGETIRGARAQEVIGDEFSSIIEEVFNVVVLGFGSVSGDPVARMRLKSRQKILKRLGFWTDEMEAAAFAADSGNQTTIAGTASFQFNHFYKRWKHQRDVILSRGDPQRLKEIFPEGLPLGFDWRNYSILRVPYSLIPDGFMDEGTIGQAMQTTTKSQFHQEYCGVFPRDSNGFFRRSVIERCTVCNPEFDPVEFPSSDGPIDFRAALKGDPASRYVYGIDPASESDNFAVAILEVHKDHRRLVHCWTTKKSDHRTRKRAKKAKADFYGFVNRHLRDLFELFPPLEVFIDAQGGGNLLVEEFMKPEGLREGELPIYRTVDPDEPRDEDNQPGLHILTTREFASKTWLSEANWGLQKDLETRVLLFPRCDELAFGEAFEADREAGRIEERNGKIVYVDDSLETVLHEIEDLKDELASIEFGTTPTGHEKWQLAGGEGSTSRKDRYSALLLAADGARRLAHAAVPTPRPQTTGRRVGESAHGKEIGGQLYTMPPRLQAKLGAAATYGRLVGAG